MMASVLHIVALLGYVAAAVLFGAAISLREPRHGVSARLLFVLAVSAHTGAIGAFCAEQKVSPFASGYGTLSVASWVAALTYLPIELRKGVAALGALIAPVCSLLLFGALTRLRTSASTLPALKSGLTSLHVLLILLSFALFAIAACCAAVYVWQYGLLKHPDRRALYRRLPPLETVDGLAYHLVAFALPLLTVGLALGFVNVANLPRPSNPLTDPHTLMSFAAWLVYSGYLAARLAAGWRGTRLNYLLIVGLAVTLAIYFVPSTTHTFT
jgi:ABC-type uncharacterized transport system permease subunit